MAWWSFWRKKEEEIDSDMKYLVVGLGNIGAEYSNTRHNIGFEVVDHLASEKEVSFASATQGAIAKIKHRGRHIILLKPSTYMNLSGKAVRYWLQKEKIEQKNLLVIVDDLNINFGQIRLRAKGSDGGHNGIKDINQMLGQNYARLRVGIGDDFKKGQQIDFVLGKWDTDERAKLPDIIKKSADMALSFAAIGLAHTMNQFNQKK
jgi:peptidyl-tRNA hydrolase